MIRPALGLAAALSLMPAAWAQSDAPFASSDFGGLRARALGPGVMSGRIAAIDVSPDGKSLWVGAASGGVWKSSDGGVTLSPVFDAHTQSIGALMVDPSDANTIWVGTGESRLRNSVAPGDGVHVSRDEGASWKHAGLGDSQHIARLAIDPQDGSRVFVCATGPAFREGGERGVFRTTDGGETWEAVLSVDARTGCSDIVMDPANPRILYAGMWQVRRYPDFFESGGPGSGLYRSIDGGDSWQLIERGLDEGEKGRISLAVAPSRPNVVYAIVESDDTALYRSDDNGSQWQRLNASANVQVRPFYFGELVVSPDDHQRVYRPALFLTVSEDGGASFSGLFSASAGGTHPDHHALWVNPDRPEHLILGTDGGIYVSESRGSTWRMVGSLPVAQFYHVAVDDAVPYNVYGGLQDNGTWMGPSEAPGGVRNKHWQSIGYGDGFWVFPDPADRNTVYLEYQGGNLMRRDMATGEIKSIAPVAAAGEPKLRFNWNTPIHLSPSQPGVLYYGSQFLHRSTDRGESWEVISPDLTSNDPRRQRQATSGGLSLDNSTAENNTTLYSIDESPLEAGVIWTGSDDGRVHLSRDNGATWTHLTSRIDGAPVDSWVSRVHASPHAAPTVFVAFDHHRSGDQRPYLFRSDDYGNSWRSLVGPGLEGYVWTILQDPVNPDLLYAGTEFGLYISLDGGAHWARFTENLPRVAVHDVVIQPREGDLVIGTHGRGIYVIDDLSSLRALSREVLEADVTLLPSRPALQRPAVSMQEFPGNTDFVAENPPEAATISYYLKRRHVFGDLLVRVYDADGELINEISGSRRRGLNRVEWPMRLKAPRFPPSTQLVPGFVGPRVPEGNYRIELVKGKEVIEGRVELLPDPRSPHSAEDRRAQQTLAMSLYRELDDLTYLAESLAMLHKDAGERASALKGGDARRVNAFAERIDTLAATLAARTAGFVSGDTRLREHYGNLYGQVTGYDGRPTATQVERHAQLQAQLRKAEADAAALIERELADLNRRIESAGLQPLVRIDRETWEKRSGGGGMTQRTRATLRQAAFPLMSVWFGLMR